MHIKTVLFIMILLYNGDFLFAQSFPTDPETKKIIYQETVEIEGQEQSQIYDKTKKWLTVYFSDIKEIKEEKEKSTVSKKGSFPVVLTYDYKYKYEHTVLFDISVQHKDGKYRYTITDFTIFDNRNDAKSAIPLEAFYQKQRYQNKKELFNNFNNEMTKLQEALKKAVETGDIKDEDDW